MVGWEVHSPIGVLLLVPPPSYCPLSHLSSHPSSHTAHRTPHTSSTRHVPMSLPQSLPLGCSTPHCTSPSQPVVSMKYTSLAPSVPSSSVDSVGQPAFPAMTEWRDLSWALLFCAHLTAVCGVSGWLLASGRVSLSASLHTDYSASTPLLVWPSLIALFASALLLSLVLALAYLSLLRLAPARVIHVTLYGGAAVLLVSAIAALLSASLYGALLCGLMFVLQLLWVWSVQRRIAFSALLLELSVVCLQEFPSTLAIPLCGLLAQAVWFAVWLLCFATLRSALSDGRPLTRPQYRDDSGGMQLLFIVLLLSLYWTAEVLNYVVHTSVAGVAGSFYFLHPHRTPSNVVFASVRRSLTSSFGSVCLGALIVASVQTARSLLNMLVRRQYDDRERSVVLACALWCAQCLLSLIEGIIQLTAQHTTSDAVATSARRTLTVS